MSGGAQAPAVLSLVRTGRLPRAASERGLTAGLVCLLPTATPRDGDHAWRTKKAAEKAKTAAAADGGATRGSLAAGPGSGSLARGGAAAPESTGKITPAIAEDPAGAAGTAEAAGEAEADGSAEGGEEAEDGRIEGTGVYLAPEVIRGSTPTIHADYWAFGCLVYQCLAGRWRFAVLSGWRAALPVLVPGTHARSRGRVMGADP